jgi:hypothetical protein
VLGLPTTTSTLVDTYATSHVTETIYSVLGQLMRYTLKLTGGFKAGKPTIFPRPELRGYSFSA